MAGHRGEFGSAVDGAGTFHPHRIGYGNIPNFNKFAICMTWRTHALYDTYHMVVNQETVVSFMLLFAVGMFVSLIVKPTSLPGIFSADHKFAGGKLPYFAGLIVQLIFIPILWTHSSNDAQFFGRFSVTFMAVVIMNMALIAAILLLIWRLPQIQAFLRREPKRLPVYVRIFMLVVLDAAGRAADARYALECGEFLGCHSTQFACGGLVGMDIIFERPVGEAAQPDCVSQHCPGFAFSRGPDNGAALVYWRRFAETLVRGGFCSSNAGIGLGLCYRTEYQAAGRVGASEASNGERCDLYHRLREHCNKSGTMMPDFVVFAREWDDRHALLLELKKSGQKHIEIPPRAFDLHNFLLRGAIVADDGYTGFADLHLLEHYGFDSITLTDNS